MVEAEWKKPTEIPDGSHAGEITKIDERHQPFEYIDVFIKIDEFDLELKYGCPNILTPKSKLGRLLITFGAKPEEGEKIDIDELLVGKRVSFMTMKEKRKDGKEFAEIVENSVKPEVAESVVG